MSPEQLAVATPWLSPEVTGRVAAYAAETEGLPLTEICRSAGIPEAKTLTYAGEPQMQILDVHAGQQLEGQGTNPETLVVCLPLGVGVMDAVAQRTIATIAISKPHQRIVVLGSPDGSPLGTHLTDLRNARKWLMVT